MGAGGGGKQSHAKRCVGDFGVMRIQHLAQVPFALDFAHETEGKLRL